MRNAIYLIFTANLLAVLLIWWLGNGTLITSHGSITGAITAFGRLFGLLAEFLVLIEIILVSRIPLFEKHFGFDELNRLHRTIGYYLVSTIILHPLFLVIGYAKLNEISLWAQFVDFITNWQDVLKALIGIALFVTVGLFSIPWIRKKLKYEHWHLTHLLMYVAIILFWGHQVNTADVSHGAAKFYWYTINFLVLDSVVGYRLLRPFTMALRRRFTVEKVIPETGSVNSVYITGKNMESWKFDPGQYVHVSFLTKGMWAPHPFSLSQAPNGKSLRISIKALGDYTKKIKELQPGTKVLIEGPLGRFTKRAAVKNKFLFIAGGIGITPIYALIQSLSKEKADMALIYGNRSLHDIAFKNEIERMCPRIHHILSETPKEGYEFGRVDMEKIGRLVPDYRERDIYICGPAPMRDSIREALKKDGVPRSHIHFEKFGY